MATCAGQGSNTGSTAAADTGNSATSSGDTSSSSGSGGGRTSIIPMGAVKILLTDIIAPPSTNNHYESDHEKYIREIKAIIVGLTRVEVQSASRGWVEAVNLTSTDHPDGAFFELIGVKKGGTPELGIFQPGHRMCRAVGYRDV